MKIKSNSFNKEIIKKFIEENKKKKPQFGNNRSFSCNSTKRSWKLNKQKLVFNDKKYTVSQKFVKILKKKFDL